MELILYLVILAFATVFAFKKEPVPYFWFSKLFFMIFLIHSIVIRLSGFDVDMVAYANSMKFESLRFYFLREPVVWLALRWIYSIIGSEVVVFVVVDMIAGVLIYFTFRRLHVPQYLYFAFLAFFPFILGIQNIYRQWFSEILFIFAFSILAANGVRGKGGYIVYFASVLSHNVAGVFLPLFLRVHRRAEVRIGSWLVLLAIPFGLIVAEGTKSSASTGASLGFAYIVLILIFVMFFAMTGFGYVSRREKADYVILFFTLGISLSAILVLASAGGERVSMFGLMVLYPMLAMRIETRFKHKIFLRVVYSLSGFFPILFFGTREFIV